MSIAFRNPRTECSDAWEPRRTDGHDVVPASPAVFAGSSASRIGSTIDPRDDAPGLLTLDRADERVDRIQVFPEPCGPDLRHVRDHVGFGAEHEVAETPTDSLPI